MKDKSLLVILIVFFVLLNGTFFIVNYKLEKSIQTISISGDNIIFNNAVEKEDLGYIDRGDFPKDLSGVLFLKRGLYNLTFGENNEFSRQITINVGKDYLSRIGVNFKTDNNYSFIILTEFDIKECKRLINSSVSPEIICSYEFNYYHELGHSYFNNLNESEKDEWIKKFNEETNFPREYSKTKVSEYYSDLFALNKLGVKQ